MGVIMMLASVITSRWDMWHLCYIVDPSSETVSVMTVILLWLVASVNHIQMVQFMWS